MRNSKKPRLALASALAIVCALPLPGTAHQPDTLHIDLSIPPIRMVARPHYQLGVYIGSAEGRGVAVTGVTSGGPAEEAGIRKGDVVTSVAGRDLTQPLNAGLEEEFHGNESIEAQRLRVVLRDLLLEEEEPVEVLVLRGDETLAFDVVPRKRYVHFVRGLTEIRDRMRHDMAGETYATARALRDSALKAQESALRLMRDTLHAAKVWAHELKELAVDTGLVRLGEQTAEAMSRLADSLGRWKTKPRIAVSGAWGLLPGHEVHLDGWSYFGHAAHGLDLVELNPDLGAYFGTSSGVLIADVDEDSATGLRAGDVVVSVDGREVGDIEKLRRILRSYEHDEEIRFGIWRDGAQTTVEGALK